MSEVEFNRLLEAVKMAMEPASQEDFLARQTGFAEPPRAANDNGGAWPLIPFPGGLVRRLLRFSQTLIRLPSKSLQGIDYIDGGHVRN